MPNAPNLVKTFEKGFGQIDAILTNLTTLAHDILAYMMRLSQIRCLTLIHAIVLG